MKRVLLVLSISVIAVLLTVSSCVHKPYTAPVVPAGNMPQEIADILVAKCAVSGCHNAASYTNADHLLLDTWEHLFQGSNSGSVVVPYSPVYSPLLYFVNTDSSLGLVATPTMPLSTSSAPATLLTKQEYTTLYNWIARGAPDKNGNIAFAGNAATRQKIYVAQGLSDMMAVIDAQSMLILRYISIGATSTQIEAPHCTRVSNDGNYAYVSFLSSNYVQKIDTRTDQIVGNADVGSLHFNYSWSILYLSPSDSSLITSSYDADGLLGFVTTAGMQVTSSIGGGNTLVFPHGITSNRSFDTFFVTAQYGNVVYKVTKSPIKIKMLSLDSNPAVVSTSTTTSNRNPHEILMSPDYSRYFVSCMGTNEIRVMDAHKDTVIAVIPVGTYPQDMAISTTVPYIFVTCREDSSNNAGMRGSVYAINYNTFQTIRIDGDFFQPHGIAVDDQNGLLYVISLNENGPPSHHPVVDNGRAGWYSVIDLKTMHAYNNRRYQLLSFPYSAATRFK